MKTVSPDLHELIKSLSKTEKRYFKVFTSRHVKGQENNYNKLIDAIEQQEMYDEDKIRERFAKETFIRHLPSEKNYLYQLILDSLFIYQLNLSWTSKMSKMLAQVRILGSRGLNHHAKKMLKKIKDKCLEMDMFEYLPQVFEMERIIMVTGSFNGYKISDFEKNREEEKNVYLKMNNLLEYKHLQLKQVHLMYTIGEARTKNEQGAYDAIMNHPVMQNENKALSLSAKLIHNNIHVNYYKSVIDQLQKGYAYSKRNMQLLEQHDAFLGEYPSYYIACLNNHLDILVHSKKGEEFFLILEKYKSFPGNYKIKLSKFSLMRIVLNYHYYRLKWLVGNGEFNAIKEYVNEITRDLKQYDNADHVHMANGIMLYYYTSYMYFGCGEYKLALKWINKLLLLSGDTIRKDISSMARLIQVIIHYELNNADLVDYSSKVSRSILKKQERIYETEQIVFELMNQLQEINQPKEREKAFKNAKIRLIAAIKANPEESLVLEKFDLTAWIDSKINKTSFEMEFRKKNKIN